jgi:imidazolonepropionase-like amidohydrolase
MNMSGSILLLANLTFAFHVGQTHEQPQPTSVAFTHVTVIDATGSPAKANMTVVITGDRIAAIGRTGSVSLPDGARVVAATGKFLIPGLWDMHSHSSWQFRVRCIAPGSRS